MPLQTESPWNHRKEGKGVDEYPLFNDHCMNIISRLRNTRLIDSFNDNLEALTLRFDNIKLRFVIWLRSTHNLKSKSEKAILELLTRLDLFLLHESETIRYAGAYGMVDAGETDDLEHSDEATECSVLENCFRSYVNKYLERKHLEYENETAPNAWIVTEPVQCLEFLAILDSLIEDLFSYTSDDLSVALSTGYASYVTKAMTKMELLAVQKSGLSHGNLICHAAATQLKRLEAGSNRREAGTIETLFEAAAQENLENVAGPSGTHSASPSTSSASKTPETASSISEKFARIVNRSKQTQEHVLKQDYPISQLAQRRVMAELRNADESSPYISIACLNDDISNLLGIIRGPPDTPYENGIFFIKIDIPVTYPLKPAKYRFISKIYHPNIDTSGRVCVKISDRQWSVGCALWGLLASILSLLAEPNPNDPLMVVIAGQYKNNRKDFDKTAREWVEAHACQDWPKEYDQTSTSKPTPISEDWVDLDEYAREESANDWEMQGYPNLMED